MIQLATVVNVIMQKLESKTMVWSARIDAAAKALREHDMAGRITRKWADLPNSDKRKWAEKAIVALNAAAKVDDAGDVS